MRYLLDANILSALVHREPAGVSEYVRSVGQANVCTSIIVAAELRFGVAKKRSVRLMQRVEELLATIDVLPLEEPADTVYGDIRMQLEKRGRPIGANDLFIAAHAISSGCTLVSANEREFSQVPGLRLENWLRSI
jgi:tRNA(fMet)-specific endonuclease VapC